MTNIRYLLLIYILGCNGGNPKNNYCSKAITSGGNIKTDIEAVGGFIVIEKGDNSKDIKTCSIQLSDHFEKAKNGFSSFITSNHCFDWINDDLENSYRLIYAKEKGGYFKVPVELKHDFIALQELRGRLPKKFLDKYSIMPFEHSLLRCEAAQYASQFDFLYQNDAFGKFIRAKLTQDTASLDQEKFKKVSEINSFGFEGVLCYQAFDNVAVQFKLKNPGREIEQYLLKNLPGIAPVDLKRIADQTDFVRLAIARNLIFENLKTGEYEIIEKALKSTSFLEGAKDQIPFDTSSPSAIDNTYRRYQTAFYNDYIRNSDLWVFNMDNDADNKEASKPIDILANYATSEGGKRSFGKTTIQASSSSSIKSNSAFSIFGTFLVKQDGSKVKALGIKQSDSGAGVYFEGKLVAVLAAVGHSGKNVAVVKASSKLDFDQEITLAKVEMLKEQIKAENKQPETIYEPRSKQSGDPSPISTETDNIAGIETDTQENKLPSGKDTPQDQEASSTGTSTETSPELSSSSSNQSIYERSQTSSQSRAMSTPQDAGEPAMICN